MYVEGTCKWWEQDLPRVSKHNVCERIYFAACGVCDVYTMKVLESGIKKVNQLQNVICNRGINLSTCRLLLLAVVRPTLEYISQVWEPNETWAAALRSVVLGGLKHILG